LARGERLIDTLPAVLLREAWEIGAPPMLWITNRSYHGKAFARLESGDGPLCLRRYPVGTSPQWLRAIHQAVDELASRGFELIPPFIPTPRGETVVRHVGSYYDLSPWIDGDRYTPGPYFDRLASLCEAIGRLHQAGRGAKSPPVRLDWLSPRHLEIQKLAWDSVARGRDSWHDPANLAAFFEPLSRSEAVAGDARARSLVETATAALDWIGRANLPAQDDNPETLTHGDLWIDHVRFAGARVLALLDHDTLGLRPPAGDLAALCGDFAEWDLAACAAILDGYRRHYLVSELGGLPRLAALRAVGVLRERLRAWLDPARRNTVEGSLEGPVQHYRSQLRTLMALDLAAFRSI
jgi:Ser/Thr protein kinase RdoA (MazF antagonist)